MNPRFEELYKSCRSKEALASQEQVQSANVLLGTEVEKFAELIVRECVSLIRKQSIGEEILGGQRYKTVQLGETIATITEHFGVE